MRSNQEQVAALGTRGGRTMIQMFSVEYFEGLGEFNGSRDTTTATYLLFCVAELLGLLQS
jgi:hypothetical protein